MDSLFHFLGFVLGISISYLIWNYSEKLGCFLVDIINKIKK